MKNKTTLTDIAKECNVSIATVSYVLNHSSTENISHQTRWAITEAAVRLNYIPPKKKKINPGRFVHIIINLKKNECQSKKLSFYDLSIELSNCLRELNFYSVITVSTDIEETINNIDKNDLAAIIFIDLECSNIHSISKKFVVPIIFLECDLKERIFCSIYTDYESIYKSAVELFNTHSLFIMIEDYCNITIKEYIQALFPTKDIFINYPGSDLENFLSTHKNCCGIAIGDYLGFQAEKYFDNAKLLVVSNFNDKSGFSQDTNIISITNKTKAMTATQIFKSIQNMDFFQLENNTVLLKPEKE